MFVYKYFLTSHLGIRLEKVECIVIFDEVTKMPNERENYEGIVKRELKEGGTIPLSSLYVTFLDCKEVYGVG